MLKVHEDDYNLFQRCTLDDFGAKNELFQMYTPYIEDRVSAQVPEQVVDDVVNDVHVKILVSITRNQYKGNSALQTYIHSIVAFAIADFYWKEYRRRDKEALFAQFISEIAAGHLNGPSDMIQEGFLDYLLSSITTKSQVEFVRLMLKGYSFSEASKELGITYEAGRSRYRRAIKSIRKDVEMSNILEV